MVLLCVPLSLSIIFSWFIHVVLCINIYFCSWITFHLWTYQMFYIHSTVDRHLCCLHILVVNSAAINIYVNVFVWEYIFVSLGCIPTSDITGACGNSVFNFFRNCQTIFPSGCTILCAHQWCMRFQFCHIFANIWYYLFFYSYPSGYEVVSHCGIDIFPQWIIMSNLFMCLFSICISSLEKYLFKFLSIVLFVFLLLSCKSSSYVLYKYPLWDMYLQI